MRKSLGSIMQILGGILGLVVLIPMAVLGGAVLWVLTNFALGMAFHVKLPLWVMWPLAVVAGVMMVAGFAQQGRGSRAR